MSVSRTAAKPYSWLDKKVADQERKSIANMVFVLIFEYPKKESRLLPLALPEAVNRLLAAQFQIEAHVNRRAEEIFILIGLCHDTLVEEATFNMTELPLMCRVKGRWPLKCALPFHMSLQVRRWIPYH